MNSTNFADDLDIFLGVSKSGGDLKLFFVLKGKDDKG